MLSFFDYVIHVILLSVFITKYLISSFLGNLMLICSSSVGFSWVQKVYSRIYFYAQFFEQFVKHIMVMLQVCVFWFPACQYSCIVGKYTHLRDSFKFYFESMLAEVSLQIWAYVKTEIKLKIIFSPFETLNCVNIIEILIKY